MEKQARIWKYLKAEPFFKDMLPHIKSHRFKIRGANSRGGDTDFSEQEIEEINAALEKIPLAKFKKPKRKKC